MTNPTRETSNYRQIVTCTTCEYLVTIDIESQGVVRHMAHCCELLYIGFEFEGSDSEDNFYSAAIASHRNSICDEYVSRSALGMVE